MIFMYIKWGDAGWRCFVLNRGSGGRAESEQDSGNAALYPLLVYSSRDVKSSWQLRVWLTSLCCCHEQTRKVMDLPGTKCHDCTFEKGLRCSRCCRQTETPNMAGDRREAAHTQWNKKVWPWYENAFFWRTRLSALYQGWGTWGDIPKDA